MGVHLLEIHTSSMPPKARPKKASSRKMPPPLPKGEVLVDGIMKQEWIIGQSIGKGGFGEIYTAALKGKDLKDAQHVIKIVSDLKCWGWSNGLF